eukprot:CAMPEP_0174828546 /NCGR_PEP_ID=MMETSP1114-20130205/1397_1 /TAXON_ID=312471 /ORGANISM="Neobodo designis, Strain CCAP 1951/1" /LENGTH=195 /DNA_ID=CAMNT_0016062267 /DNA_START=49 /DNA_END=636 /DNA_ORIENTATION=+
MDGEGPTNAVEAQLLAVAEQMERAVDDELARIDNMEDEDLEAVRAKRRKQVADMAKRRDQWLQRGHGSYHEVTDAKHFFQCVKQSERVVVHFKRSATERCAIVDGHLQKIAREHFETRFCSVDVEKIPALPQEFNVMMLPTLMLVEGGNTFHSIIGFDEFGNHDDFSTDDMVKVLSHHGMVNERGMFAADQYESD